ncbi:MAG: CoB--CoM heterodisulfide reductase iron-sulfur subunit A family protein [Deltaproteobacteria bacterium]|nr:CoB--CoM heterodisulfide reductase iron-sulfur subunit A family protein [Deltaproteobacteria bacterium]
MSVQYTREVDVLVLGGGIGGLQAAVDLADRDLHVLVVERDTSIGGRMIALSKVFPTLDCASCITTPKMAEAAHHDMIDILTYTELESVERADGSFRCQLRRKPRFVDEKDCIGCRLCEYACPILLPNEFEGGEGARKAIYIPHSNAYPQCALLDIDNCIYCGQCIKACPTDAVHFAQEAEEIEVRAGAVVLATGYELTPMEPVRRYGAGKLPNVISPLLMERLIAPHGPYGKVLRPSDGKIPDSIAYVQCAGSRDASMGVPYCSRVCCMYAIKQAILVSGALPLVDVTIYYMDIRAFGKGFETFYQEAKAMGIQFVCGKVASISEDAEHNPIIRVERKEEGGEVCEDTHDLVVLSQGMVPAWKPADKVAVSENSYGFIEVPEEKIAPTATKLDGVFVAGTAAGPKDIVDTIVEAGAAAAQASAYLESSGWLQKTAAKRSYRTPEAASTEVG